MVETTNDLCFRSSMLQSTELYTDEDTEQKERGAVSVWKENGSFRSRDSDSDTKEFGFVTHNFNTNKAVI